LGGITEGDAAFLRMILKKGRKKALANGKEHLFEVNKP